MSTPLTSLFRKIINYLGAHSFSRKLFFLLGFVSVRFIFPLQYLLLRELMDCESVLDLGCGPHSMVPIIPSKIHTVGVEQFAPYYNEIIKNPRHKEYVHSDIRTVEFPPKSFDAVVMLDVIEHLTREDGEAMLQKMSRWARKKVIIFTPNGFLHQESYDSNPGMKHLSGWKPEDFYAKNFKVYGVRGFKWLKKECCHEPDAKPDLREGIADLTQIISYHFPKSAFQLFCVKHLVP